MMIVKEFGQQIPLSFRPPVENSFPDSCQQSAHFPHVHDDHDDHDDDGDDDDDSSSHNCGDYL